MNSRMTRSWFGQLLQGKAWLSFMTRTQRKTSQLVGWSSRTKDGGRANSAANRLPDTIASPCLPDYQAYCRRAVAPTVWQVGSL
jgi:hypothetical protein